MSNRQPPALARWLLRIQPLGTRRVEILQDLTYAGRICRRSPGVVIVAVAGLGIAIGFSTSIFSIAARRA
jgi:hypothetical protein